MQEARSTSKHSAVILGAGITGLTAAIKLGLPIYEAETTPGGICASYYMRAADKKRLNQAPGDDEVYRFEIAGGHWIFGADESILQFIRKFTSFKSYRRRSAVYFSEEGLYVPYPLQNNLRFLRKRIAKEALKELSSPSKDLSATTMKEWLTKNFGLTLCKLFFWPFNDTFTAGLYEHIKPQDFYKTPIDSSLIIQGFESEVPPAGYNITFVYPEGGLDVLIRGMAEKCNITYKKRVTKIDVRSKDVYFADGSIVSYKKLISTLPLRKVMEMTELKLNLKPCPYTSVLVLNIGALRGERCPDEHWLYIPDSKSGFHRVGFYSNVDSSFLPKSSRNSGNRVSIYVERGYQGGQRPSEQEIEAYVDSVVAELQGWSFIADVEVIDHTWTDVAYSWCWSDCYCRQKPLQILKEHGVYQLGRYGRWKFQGIADSIMSALRVDNDIFGD
ncbi:MAG: FAD-dependent oxidoreductase [Candidatus Omnitrophota bacterium]|nr:MAG: FAD-dependent oxidoreductase [Candidatus Omnitrophota bacterium]